MTDRPETASRALLTAMTAAGVRYLFANLGSDHTGIIEAYARAQQDGTLGELPELVICPHEFVALSAAQGYTQVTGQPQAVLVHVDCGTQNLGGAVHNAARDRVPVLILAGLSPVTQHGELPGSRTEFIHWLQDTADQAGLVRGYVKYAQEIRRGHTARQLVHRALQIARSEPSGPVYLAASREVLEELVPPEPDQSPWRSPVAPAALAPEVADELAGALLGAANPLVVTSYLGRDPDAVAALTDLCELMAAGVLESAPMRMNFPADHPLHLGYQWNTAGQNPVLGAADVVLVAGSDVPWIPVTNSPPSGARIYMLDADPVKEQMTLWHIPATRYARADLAIALRQVAGAVRRLGGPDRAATEARAQRLAATHQAQRAEWAAREQPGPDGTITPAYLVACVRDAIGPDALVLTEAVTSYQVVSEHLVVGDRLGEHERIRPDHLPHAGDQVGGRDRAVRAGLLAGGPLRPLRLVRGREAFSACLGGRRSRAAQPPDRAGHLPQRDGQVRPGVPGGRDVPQRHLLLDRVGVQHVDPGAAGR